MAERTKRGLTAMEKAKEKYVFDSDLHFYIININLSMGYLFSILKDMTG